MGEFSQSIIVCIDAAAQDNRLDLPDCYDFSSIHIVIITWIHS